MVTRQMQSDRPPAIQFAWLELTRKCNLNCVHCYANCGPTVSHGSMDAQRWKALIEELVQIGATSVQFIGGEPTLFPAFPKLVSYAVSQNLAVEVFSNLTYLPSALIRLFKSNGVSVATSYYSDDPARHEKVTRSPLSHSRTLDSICRMLAEGITLRVGIIKIHDDQRAEEACEQLKDMGVTNVKIDRLRAVGRGASEELPRVDELCGACSGDNLAIASDGSVFPCVFARWLPAGNVRRLSVTQVLATGQLSKHKRELALSFSSRASGPEKCQPTDPWCPPCAPAIGCRPKWRKPEKESPVEPCKPSTCVPTKRSPQKEQCGPVDPHCGPCTPWAPPCTPKT